MLLRIVVEAVGVAEASLVDLFHSRRQVRIHLSVGTGHNYGVHSENWPKTSQQRVRQRLPRELSVSLWCPMGSRYPARFHPNYHTQPRMP